MIAHDSHVRAKAPLLSNLCPAPIDMWNVENSALRLRVYLGGDDLRESSILLFRGRRRTLHKTSGRSSFLPSASNVFPARSTDPLLPVSLLRRLPFPPSTACNVLLQPLSESPVYTLRNYGRRVNCSAAFIFPMNFRILATSIGSQGFSGSANAELETGLITKVSALTPSPFSPTPSSPRPVTARLMCSLFSRVAFP